MSLFEASEKANRRRAQPLAARMRPATLDEFVGQQHFLGEGKLLRRLLAADRLGSVIFYGPPGTGKTTLAHLLAQASRSKFVQLSAVTSGVKELREVLDEARDRLSASGNKTLLFVDEIHRFNKSQQDVLLPDVEEGVVILVGATTQNPFFAINSALVSRSRVFQFEPLSNDDIKALIRRALADRDRGLGQHDVRLHDDALEFLAEVSDGDARRALKRAGRSACCRATSGRSSSPARWPKNRCSARRWNTIAPAMPITTPSGALIKSMRGSDPDAAIYWLARMLEAGEDVRFLARRIVILASEDVGNADPHALPLAIAADASLRIRRPARVPAEPGPGGDVPGLRARNRTRRRWPSAKPAATCAKGGCCRCPSSCATAIIRPPNDWDMARVINTPTTAPTPSPPKTIWASTASITVRLTVGWSASWPNRANSVLKLLWPASVRPDFLQEIRGQRRAATEDFNRLPA